MAGDRARADAAMFERGFAESREEARRLILGGFACADGKLIAKPSEGIAAGAEIRVTGAPHYYVSRGGLKLARALDAFGIDPSGKACLDVGASTGGFTDALLQRGASAVYAIDVGHGQLDERIRNHPRVKSYEGVDARDLGAADLPNGIALAAVDVSFISLMLVLPSVARALDDSGEIVCLVKTQYEAGRVRVGKGARINDRATHERVIEGIARVEPAIGLKAVTLAASPIRGSDGNVEYLMLFSRSRREISEDAAFNIRETVSNALRGEQR